MQTATPTWIHKTAALNKMPFEMQYDEVQIYQLAFISIILLETLADYLFYLFIARGVLEEYT